MTQPGVEGVPPIARPAATPAPSAAPSALDDAAGRVLALLRQRGQSVAVAESLTGGMLVARLIDVPGASGQVAGGIVAYQTALKHELLGVAAELLAEHGPVHPEVAVQMARGVRERARMHGAPADWGIATTGVAGPEPQGGHPAGTVFLGLADARGARHRRLELAGSRAEIREATVRAALAWLEEELRAADPRQP